MISVSVLIAPFLFFVVVTAQDEPQWDTTPFNAPSPPLTVRTPYLNTEMPQGNNPAQSGRSWPQFLTNSQVMGWSAAVRVDGHTYSILGDTVDPATDAAIQTSVQFTATRTIFNYTAGSVGVTAVLLSPVYPSDIVRQSIPFMYLSISVSSNDEKPHSVQLYSDISAESVLNGTQATNATWSSNTDGNIILLRNIQLSPLPFNEENSIGQDPTAYFGMEKSSNVSWQISTDHSARGLFNSEGTLSSTQDDGFPRILENVPVFAISKDLGMVQAPSSPVVWTVGLLRDPAIQYLSPSSSVPEQRSSLWWFQFDSVKSLVEFVLDDYENAVSTAMALDLKIQTEAFGSSSNYADLAVQSLRQVMGTMDITIKKGPGTTVVRIFVGSIEGVGNGGVNSVDVLYAAFPAILYINDTWLSYLLSSLLEYQDSKLYTESFAAQDIDTGQDSSVGSPAQRAVFPFLALTKRIHQLDDLASTDPNSTSNQKSSESQNSISIGTIVGAIAGPITGLAIFIALTVCCVRRHRRRCELVLASQPESRRISRRYTAHDPGLARDIGLDTLSSMAFTETLRSPSVIDGDSSGSGPSHVGSRRGGPRPRVYRFARIAQQVLIEVQLRSEIDVLRQELQMMRSERDQSDEIPPSYTLASQAESV